MRRVRDWWWFTVLAGLFLAGTVEAAMRYVPGRTAGPGWLPRWAEIIYIYVALAVAGMAVLVALVWLHQAVDDWQAGRRARVTK